MNRDFKGIYAPHIKELIELKRSLGFKYVGEEFIFSVFDRLTIERNETTVCITKELSDAWCRKRDNESNSYHYKRCFQLYSFSSFLCKKGLRSYLPQLPPVRSTFIPHIFSKREIEAIFDACDNLQSGNNDMRSTVFIMPSLIRTLYSTGIRIGEALSLVNGDVNLQENYFVLRDTKNGADRLVPFPVSLSEVLKEYVFYRSKLPIVTSEESLFFIKLNGANCDRDVVYRRFRKVLALANIPKGRIRLHDVRHTFAVHSLAAMAEEGMDLYCSLPVLSTFLGHQSLRATNGYVRLTADMYPELIKKIDVICFDVFPKIPQS
jgi:site-specific recombinase XerD